MFNVAVISDIHFGAMDPDTLLHELNESFIKKIYYCDDINLVVIDGDLFHKKLSLNSSHSKAAFMFLTILCNLAKEKNFKVRLVRGTLFHDNDQLENAHMFSDICDFKMYEHLTKETIDDIDILFIPEEYIDDESYFDEVYHTHCDLCFGHGMVKEASFEAEKQESGITMKKSPIFDTKRLLSVVDGVAMFGHIHTPMVIKKRFYYCGSFSRWCFGEEEPKGFHVISYDKENPENTKVQFFQNDLAPIYDTISLEIKSSDIEKVIKTIQDVISFGDYYRRRVIVNITNEVSNRRLMKDTIMETFSKFNKIKLVINSMEEELMRKQVDEKVERLLDEYGFIFDKTISKEEKIQRYIKKKYDRDITLENIREYLFSSIRE